MKCHQCPVRPGLVCLGETTPSLCRRVAEGQPGRADQLVALAEADAAPNPTPSPSLMTMAVGLAGAVVAHVVDGGRKASQVVQDERRAICRSNVCGQHDGGKDGCTACGCGLNPALSFIGLDFELKRSLASSRCPSDPPRWTAS
jgi:hypothetical protein